MKNCVQYPWTWGEDLPPWGIVMELDHSSAQVGYNVNSGEFCNYIIGECITDVKLSCNYNKM